MESFLEWLTLHADSAHYIIFAALLLTGFSLPISEEIMLILGGVLASSVVPEKTMHLFIAVFLGCYLSDCIAYWLGRSLKNKFKFTIKKFPFSHTLFQKYGFLTLFVGRFIPFGVRNGIFMTAGATKMHFGKFAATDVIGCFVFSLAIFYLAYSCGQNYEALIQYVHQSNFIIFGIFLLSVMGIALGLWLRKRGAVKAEPS